MAGEWERFDGEALMGGMDVLTLPLSRMMSAFYVWATRGMKQEDKIQFDRWMNDDVTTRGVPQTPEETAAFLEAWGTGPEAEAGQNALLAQLGGR